ncbi:Uncharacterised protein [Legionella lansingensis]|uniref:Uncharacterized protein n=1 Tax=Legionella lansingensis TaxID=45067 RepID=A0A0W0VLF4_9GAMM|nr:hypothetical protein [Legionella lansingensis]KTD20965.1 hypothetical protein Llan_1695 [Legionella lansingensis]SNV44598.1 Uncharacterised protein [Legionella lansingensis]
MMVLSKQLLSAVLFLGFMCFKAVFAMTSPSLDEFPMFFNKQSLEKINRASLPKPYDSLLTQPLMTTTLEKYYQRQAKIKVIYSQKNNKMNTYSRAILMLMDKDKTRNDVQNAQTRKEDVVVELGLITMNFNELPQGVIHGVLHSDVPFGKLLLNHQVSVYSTGQSYFRINCTAKLRQLLACKAKDKLYGRTNILMNKVSHRWLARVIEILPLRRCVDRSCVVLN